MKYIKVFDTEKAFETYAASAGLVVPNLSYCKDMKSVHYVNKLNRAVYTGYYLTFEALEDTVFSIEYVNERSNFITQAMRESFSYSIDDGKTWTTFTTPNDTYGGTALTTPTIHAGQKVLWKGIGNQNWNNGAYCKITATGNFNVCGNIMSLLYGDNFIGETDLSVTTSAPFKSLFIENNKLISAENLILPATTLSERCYNEMFYQCSSLTTTPELPATTLATACYANMFRDCTSLTTAPELPATILSEGCYSYMFENCTSLTGAPELPATTVTNGCYSGMFSDCTSLTTAPDILPALTLADRCYNSMFSGCISLTRAPELPATTFDSTTNYCYAYMFNRCTSLNYIKAMFTTQPTIMYTPDWVNGVAATGTFVKNLAAIWTTTGVVGVPTGWTIEYALAK